MMHRNELDTLLAWTNRPNGDGLDLIGLFANLGSEFSFWLNNNNDHTACGNESMAPVFVYNQNRCKKVLIIEFCFFFYSLVY